MRKCLLLLFLCIAGFTKAQERNHAPTRLSYSQAYKQGTWSIGLQAGYGKEPLLSHSLTTQVYGGYFVANKVLIGLSAIGSQEGYNSVRDVAYSIGPIVRYQLTRTRFSPFLLASYQIGQRKVSGAESRINSQPLDTPGGPVAVESEFRIQSSGITQRLYSRSFGAGLSIGLTTSLRVDISLSWLDKVNSIDSGIHVNNGLYQPQLGVTFLPGANKK